MKRGRGSMGARVRWGVMLAAPGVALGIAGEARAQSFVRLSETDVKVTETAVFNYHFDNRDNIKTNDHYGEWLNRLNVQGTNGPLTLQLRLDSAIYAFKPDPNALANQSSSSGGGVDDLSGGGSLTPAQQDQRRQNQILGYGRDLSLRYINTVYLSKAAISYTSRGLDVTLGDFYAQLGRGLVLAMRKADELAADTTLRGVKVDYKADLGSPKLAMTALAGLTNPLRVDEVSGRQLWQTSGGAGSVLFPGAPTPRANQYYLPNPETTFAPDFIYGGRLETGDKRVVVAAQEMVMTRGASDFYVQGGDVQPTRRANRITIGSLSLSVPNIAEHGSFYVEAAFQDLSDPTVPSENEALRKLSGGKAVYAQVTAFSGPITLTLEGKHYDRFFPLMASVRSSTTEFVGLQYNAVPTTELITSDTQFDYFNTCVTGGRARVDFRGNDQALFYASLGRYRTWGEQSSTCGVEPQDPTTPAGKSDQIRNDVWDPQVGIETNFEDNRTHVYGSMGIRVDDAAVPITYDGLAEATTLYYREQWIRYDLLKKIYGPYSVEAAGVHRYRFFPAQADKPWHEGENYLSLLYSPKLSGAFGYEYTTKGGTRTDYYNGQLQYRFTTDKQIRLFVGQTRPALRCVSGVCRQFPAFEGAKLEVVIRF